MTNNSENILIISHQLLLSFQKSIQLELVIS